MRSRGVVVQRRAVRAVVSGARSTHSRREAIVVLVDGWTSVGGSQWIDSPGIGALRHLPAATRSSRSSTRAIRRTARGGLQGKSSGGYGAIVNALARPDLFERLRGARPRRALRRDAGARLSRGGALRSAERGITLDGRVLGLVRRPATSRTTRCWSSSARARSRSVTASFPFDRDTASRRCPSRGQRGSRTTRCASSSEHGPPSPGLRGVWIDAGRPRRVLPRPRRGRAAPRAPARRAFPRSGSTSSSSRRPPRHEPPVPALARLPGRLSLHHLLTRLAEAELAVERVHVRRVQEPAHGRRRGRARPSRGRAPRRGRARGRPRARRRRRGRRTSTPSVSGAAEADLRVAVVEADDARGLVDQARPASRAAVRAPSRTPRRGSGAPRRGRSAPCRRRARSRRRARASCRERPQPEASVLLVRRGDDRERLAAGAIREPGRRRVRERGREQLLDPGEALRREPERAGGVRGAHGAAGARRERRPAVRPSRTRRSSSRAAGSRRARAA